VQTVFYSKAHKSTKITFYLPVIFMLSQINQLANDNLNIAFELYTLHSHLIRRIEKTPREIPEGLNR